MDWMSLIPSALSAVSSLFGSKPPKYQAPPPPNIGQVAGQLNAAAPLYDPTSGQYAQGLNAQMNQGLPPAYRQQILDQARKETQASWDQTSQGLNMQHDRDSRSAAEQMNKLGLLSSGALGVREGYIDQSYGQQYGNLAQNLQNQLSGVSTNLMTQEMQQRQNIQQLLAGFEGDKANQSLSARNSLASYAGSLGSQNVANAGNQYQSDFNNWKVGEARLGQGLGALASAGTTYGLWKNPGPTNYSSVQGLLSSGEGASLSNALKTTGYNNDPFQLNLTNRYFKV